jgi:hypothetical protein
MHARLLSLGRHALFWLCLGCSGAFGATLNGIWSYSSGGYLVLMEVQGGAVLALRVDPALTTGEAFVGSRSGDAVQVQSLSQSSSLALTVSSDRFSGTVRSSTGSASVSGSQLLVYAGSIYDGLWQRTGDPTRYQALVTMTANALPTTLLLDMRINASTSVSYDIAVGTITTARTPTFRGASLLGARSLSLAFGSSAPLSATFTAQSSAVPPQTLEQFAATQLLPIAKTNQSITFGFAPSLRVGSTATVSATASSGLTVSYSSLTTSTCTVSGSTVTGVAAGTCTIAANQSGNTLVEAAAQVTQTLTVSATPRTSQSITFGTAPTLTVGSTAMVSATASSGLTVGYSSLTPTICSVTASTVTALAAGTCTVEADQAGNTQFDAAARATQSVTVSAANAPPTGVAVSKVSPQTVGSQTVYASTRLAVSWTAPAGVSVNQYRITATETVGNTSLNYTAVSTATSATLTGLKSGTSYSVLVSACKDAACAESGSAAASGTTPEEYWQLQGSGNSYTTLSTTVSEGSVLSWVMRWGSDAGASYSGRYQYYYKVNDPTRSGVGVATTSGDSTGVSTLTSFSPLTTSGLRSSCSDAPGFDTSTCAKGGAFEISAIQAVPMSNGKIRAFFNASNVLDNNTMRAYSLDSQDGLIGQDFHPGTQAYCGGKGSSDYAPGGACEPNLFVDVSSTQSATTPLSQSRQFKIGYDWNADWRWDGAVGTFMVITGDDNCNKYPNALFYGTWDASKWTITKDSSNCAKPIVAAAHGPVLVPLGGVAYKLYYEDQTNGPQSGKPLRLLYGDGRSSGSAATVDFEDWESSTLARQVHFLWPDGTLLDAQDEAGLGDHMILTPTGSLDLQYMFVNRGGLDNTKWKTGSYGLGLAVLLNP